MRVMVMVKATKNSEAGILPGDPRAPAGFDKLFEQMGKINEELVKAGVMLAVDGLHPASKASACASPAPAEENRRRRAVRRPRSS